MELTRQADYALRCVLEAAHHERISAAEIARRQDLSPSLVAKIVGTLARAEILETRRGNTGGVQLGRPPGQISVLEIVETVQGPIRLNRCARTPPACPRSGSCPVEPVVQRAQQALVAALSVTLEELVSGDGAAVTALSSAANGDAPTTSCANSDELSFVSYETGGRFCYTGDGDGREVKSDQNSE